jgi:ABC-type nitrate/sulfonate/bicarbonate transport system ATPase subunit
MSETAIHFSNVTFGYGNRKPLFEHLSCSLACSSGSGKIIALMGPSGVGKTTFCDLVLGTHQPQQGFVDFEPRNANMAVIPQKGVIFDELNVRENITCLKYSKSVGNTFREERVQHAVDSLGLSNVLQSGTGASALSGGEAQRVMLARIQTINCDVLILDEPCSFLDNRVKDSFLTALRDTVNESRLLALMVTHVWDEARQIADEVLFFHQTSEKRVTLHSCLVAAAESLPPTIDALFGIHWPDCVLFDLTTNVPPVSLSGEYIPNGARFVGVFLNHFGKSEGNLLARTLWNEARQAPNASQQLLRARASVIAENINPSVAFYNSDEFLIREPN